MNDPAARLRSGLVDMLTAAGWLHSPAWIETLRSVPREVFVPRYFIFDPAGGHRAISSEDPQWLRYIYDDRVLPTQLDADPAAWNRARTQQHPIGGIPTCSLSQPSLTATMLEHLDVDSEHHVLEVGTGTGYNAALLAHRLGDRRVTTMDIDPHLTATARDHLAAVGYSPTVLTADGAQAAPHQAPFDRIIATCSLPTIPPAWIAQTTPGGRILTNVIRSLDGGPIVSLTVNNDGSAQGSIIGEAGGYMPTRASSLTNADVLLRSASHAPPGSTRATALEFDPHAPEPWHVPASFALPDTAPVVIDSPDKGRAVWLVHPDGSWAFHDSTNATVEQGGPRNLWDILEAEHNQWHDAGRPSRDRYGLTVTVLGDHTLWLDDPQNAVP